MANNAANVDVGVVGSIYFDATGAVALPTSETAQIPVGYVEVGYITDGGLTEGRQQSRGEIVAWGGDVVRNPLQSRSTTLAFGMLETNGAALSIYYGNHVDGVVKLNKDETRGSWIFDVYDGEKITRTTVKDGHVTDHGDITNATGVPVAYDVTVTAYPDANGNRAVKYYGTAA